MSRENENGLENFTLEFDANSIENISVHDMTAAFFMEESNGELIEVSTENMPKGALKCEVRGNNLEIRMEDSSMLNLGFIKLPNIFNLGNLFKETRIYLRIPADKRFSDIKIRDNVGDVKVSAVRCNSFDGGSGVGNLTIERFYTQNLTLKNGVGNSSIMHGRVDGNADINGGVGDVKFDGELNGDVKIKCGVGNIMLNLYGNEKDYSIYTSSGVGATTINGKKYSDMFSHVDKTDREAKHIMNIANGVGDVKIKITE